MSVPPPDPAGAWRARPAVHGAGPARPSAAATEPYSVGRGAGSGGALIRGPLSGQDFLPRVAPPRPRRLTPDSVRIRWMKPYERPVAAARARMLSPESYLFFRSAASLS